MENYMGNNIPNVVDEHMIEESLTDNSITQNGDQDYLFDVTSLNLGYLNVIKINNIWFLENLSKLQLNNNVIEKMEGLRELKNLIWLDLSFNNIKKIEGLDSLSNLEDFSIFSNKIETIENMDNLINLQVFSIGNNNIMDVNNIIYLRRFKNLRSLTMQGNPIASDEQCRNRILAFLPSLIYLDYFAISQEMKEEAQKLFEVEIEKLDQVDAASEFSQRCFEENLIDLEKKAFVEKVKGKIILDEMFLNDEEGKLLSNIPSNKIILEEFSESLNNTCQELYNHGMNSYEERQNEISEFQKFLAETKQQNEKLAAAEIDKLTSSKNEALQALLMNSNSKTDLDIQSIEELKEGLFLLEVQLTDEIEEALKDFEHNLNDLMAGFIDIVRVKMAKCRSLEATYYDGILNASSTVFEKVLSNQLDDDFLTVELRNILMDKDLIQSSAKSSFEAHIQVIDNLEDEIISRSNAWMKLYLEKLQKEEMLRNRKRIFEVIHLIESLKDEDFDAI